MKSENINTGSYPEQQIVSHLTHHFDGIYSVQDIEELRESSLLMEEWARTACFSKSVGGMEEWAKDEETAPQPEEFCCDWYHGTWQYMRLLNMVAVPRWYRFYTDSLTEVLQRKPRARVMISACADYGMLHALHAAVDRAHAEPDIVVYDICKTPLKNSEWYARKHGFPISCVCDNIITADIQAGSFDLITTDEFLTVLKDPYKPLIIEKWKKILKPDGTLVTTAMIGGPTTPELREDYKERAYRRFEEIGNLLFPSHWGEDDKTHRLLHHFHDFAMFHTRHMLKNEDQIRKLFKDFKYLSVGRLTTPGECVNPTDSCQITARLGDWTE